jgi:ankyrin repeat protein
MPVEPTKCVDFASSLPFKQDNDRNLCWVCDFGRLDLLPGLLAQENVNIHTKNNKPLKTAISHGFLEIVECLLNHPRATFSQEDLNEAVAEALFEDEFEMIPLLVNKGARVDYDENKLLIQAASEGNEKAVLYLLARMSESQQLCFNQRVLNDALLMNAGSCYWDIACARALILYGANANHTNGFPLTDAATYGNTQMVELLLKNGCANQHPHIENAVLQAAKFGYTKLLPLLSQYGADLFADNNAALCAASENGHLGCVMYLMTTAAAATQKGGGASSVSGLTSSSSSSSVVSVSVPQHIVEYALELALKNGHVAVAEYLQSKQKSQTKEQVVEGKTQESQKHVAAAAVVVPLVASSSTTSSSSSSLSSSLSSSSVGSRQDNASIPIGKRNFDELSPYQLAYMFFVCILSFMIGVLFTHKTYSS